MADRITSPCPSCGRSSLIVGSGGYLVCGFVGEDGCRDPCAADRVLGAAAETGRQLRAAHAFIAANECTGADNCASPVHSEGCFSGLRREQASS
jgi:hypothetical protein